MEKIAIVSDIHGNYRALETVLTDINKRGIKEIYCLGDVIGKGAKSNECLDLLKDSTMVYGNWEDFINNKICPTESSLNIYNLLNEQLSDDNKDRLKTLPLCHELYISGRLVRMFHATPSDAWSNVLAIDRIEDIYKQFLPTKNTSNNIADIVVYGHTHTQNMMKLYNRTLINTGSVGNAFDIIRNKEKDGNCKNTTNANYLIIEGNINSREYDDIRFEYVSLKYDVESELKGNNNYPDFDKYSMELLTGEYRDVYKYKDNFEKAHYDYNEF